ncbi:hypothetical protein B0T14DRAFT_567045 [Immersiella caudata]|uniref:Uncharacterized protein n=1 Tax=Immersiella caudata TaxID=314043 RepID=A0AA39WS04_9PEZI|nr:hypothetical protein B0T14DRAFT_567045 [Immersiella caudata]
MPALTLPSRALRRDTPMAVNASEPAEQEDEEKDPNRHSRTPPRGSSTSASPSGSQDLVIPTANNETENTRPKATRASTGRYSMLSLSGILRDRENINLSRPAPAALRTPSGLSIFLPRKFSTSKSGKSNLSGNESSRSYRLKTFSFEDDGNDVISPSGSPEPELVVLPNKGGLDLTGSEEGAQVRTASSSYPSEGGTRSPDLTVSPPMTFGRRILSSLEAYGFSNPHFASLGSSDASADVIGDEREKSESTNEKKDAKADGNASRPVSEGEGSVEAFAVEIPEIGGHAAGTTVIEKEETMDIMSEGTLRRHPLKDEGDEITAEVYDVDDDNLSTQCMPRVSTNQDRGCLSVDNNDSILERGDYLELKPSFPRSAVSGLRHRFSHMNLKAQPVKVKKWFVRQFHASRKGSRVIVKKVFVWLPVVDDVDVEGLGPPDAPSALKSMSFSFLDISTQS